jgi:zinc/manganese transport system substrate-binding protein
MVRVARNATVAALLGAAVAGCGDSSDEAGADADRPTVVVTTNILGDVVENIAGETLNVVTIMPAGADPHEFQPSAREVAEISSADVVVMNGAGFEEGLLDVVAAAEADGTVVFETIEAVDTLEYGAGDDHDEDEHHDEEDHDEDHGDEEDHDEDHGDEEDHDEGEDHGDEEDHDEEDHDEDHGDEEDHDDHDHEGVDPHFFGDPARMAAAVDAVTSFLVDNVEGVDADTLTANASAYITELDALDEELETMLGAIPAEDRVLVTNHEVFGYFADRYGFEVAGTIIPTGSTADGASARDLADLVEVIEHVGVPAVFADVASSDELAATLAEEVGDISVVQLYSESLGTENSDGATYLDMTRTNAQRIAEALGG